MTTMQGKQDIRWYNRLQFNALWLMDHLLGEARSARWFGTAKTRVAGAIKADLVGKGPGKIQPIDRRRDLSVADFVREYLRPNIPVVLEGAASSWAASTWSPDGLAARYPDEEVILISASPEDVAKERYDVDKATLAQVVADMQNGGKRYARFNPLLQNHPELLDELDCSFLKARLNRARMGLSYQLFMGPKGTKTATHNAISNNLFIQLYGEKRWFLFSPTYNPVLAPPMLRAPFFHSALNPEQPDLTTHPLFPYMDGYEVHLKPGDILFNPSFYWHYVSNETDTIGVGFRWFAPWNIVRSSVTQCALTMMATNPSIFVARKHRQNFSKIFSMTRPHTPGESLQSTKQG